MIHIDASQGEGGGQVLRTALALSLCSGQPVHLEHIRARRPKTGLMRQHLACVRAAQAISRADVQGAELGSPTLVFEPGAVEPGHYDFEIGSAGSCTLVLQTVWPALMLASAASRVSVHGGTHNPLAPPYQFLERSFAPLVRRLGAHVELHLHRHGFYPAGGGHIEALFQPLKQELRPFDLMERGAASAAYAECWASSAAEQVARRELEALGRILGWSGTQLHAPYVPFGEGSGQVLMATLVHEHLTEVLTCFGNPRAGARPVASELAQQVRDYLLAAPHALGLHLADQWVLPLALAVARSGRAARFTCTELTEHARTNFRVIESFLPVRFRVEAKDKGWQVTLA